MGGELRGGGEHGLRGLLWLRELGWLLFARYGGRVGAFHVIEAVVGGVGGLHELVHDLGVGFELAVASDAAGEGLRDGRRPGLVVAEAEAGLREEGEAAVAPVLAPEEGCGGEEDEECWVGAGVLVCEAREGLVVFGLT